MAFLSNPTERAKVFNKDTGKTISAWAGGLAAEAEKKS